MRRGVLFAALLFGVAVVAARALAESESRRDGRISFIVGESGDSGPTPRLVIMDADGTNARVRLGWVYNTALSADGRLVVYDALGQRSRDISTATADGPLRGRLLVRNGAFADWSPNGDAIAFVRAGHGCCDGQIWIYELRSRRQWRVVRNAYAETPDWSPDGKKLAFVRGSDTWVVDLARKAARRLIRHADYPRWSPKGDRIAVARAGSIYIARADGTRARRVAEGDAAAWSPDGSELAVAEFRRVSRVPLDGRHRRFFVYSGKHGVAVRSLDWAR